MLGVEAVRTVIGVASAGDLGFTVITSEVFGDFDEAFG